MNLITILGPTATGKTSLAAHLAYHIHGEVISADSRQVFKRMDIGTGKDLDDYIVNGTNIPYHLIDIAEPGEEFSVFDFQKKFIAAFHDITSRNKQPILCGGTGLYLEAALKRYKLVEVPENKELRSELKQMSDEELASLLASLRPLHNTTDTIDRDRMIRAIEIEHYQQQPAIEQEPFPEFNSFIFGIHNERAVVKQRITRRLKERLDGGMIEEVNALIDSGVPPERLKAYGLEYKYVTQYLQKEISFDALFNLLNIAIHQFSKKQMTWFRRMERNGIPIHWIDGQLTMEEKVEKIYSVIR